MEKFTVFCLLCIFFTLHHIESMKLFKRQTLVENKKKIGASNENWALVGNIPTPTVGRITPSDEPEKYHRQLEKLINKQERLTRLEKRWIRDGDIDRERSRDLDRDGRRCDRDSQEYPGYNSRKRDGEGRRY